MAGRRGGRGREGADGRIVEQSRRQHRDAAAALEGQMESDERGRQGERVSVQSECTARAADQKRLPLMSELSACRPWPAICVSAAVSLSCRQNLSVGLLTDRGGSSGRDRDTASRRDLSCSVLGLPDTRRDATRNRVSLMRETVVLRRRIVERLSRSESSTLFSSAPQSAKPVVAVVAAVVAACTQQYWSDVVPEVDGSCCAVCGRLVRGVGCVTARHWRHERQQQGPDQVPPARSMAASAAESQHSSASSPSCCLPVPFALHAGHSACSQARASSFSYPFDRRVAAFASRVLIPGSSH